MFTLLEEQGPGRQHGSPPDNKSSIPVDPLLPRSTLIDMMKPQELVIH
jgi:hypothetical protein